jgi:hypothetical protein
MKNYTILPNNASTMFSPKDLYSLTAIYLTATKVFTNKNATYYETDVTMNQLANYKGIKISYLKNELYPRLRTSEFCEIETHNYSHKLKRNNFILPKPNTDFSIINNKVLEDELAPKLKGFIIGLYTLCEGNSEFCYLDEVQITKELKLTRATYYRHKKELIQKGYIIDHNSKNYKGGLEIRCPWLGSSYGIKNQTQMHSDMRSILLDDFYDYGGLTKS